MSLKNICRRTSQQRSQMYPRITSSIRIDVSHIDFTIMPFLSAGDEASCQNLYLNTDLVKIQERLDCHDNEIWLQIHITNNITQKLISPESIEQLFSSTANCCARYSFLFFTFFWSICKLSHFLQLFLKDLLKTLKTKTNKQKVILKTDMVLDGFLGKYCIYFEFLNCK